MDTPNCVAIKDCIARDTSTNIHPPSTSLTQSTMLRGPLLILALVPCILGYLEPHCNEKQVLVQLFNWPWGAVARECEQVLGPKGFCGVQTASPLEHVDTPEWWIRYASVSYKLESRSGSREEFIDMVQRCNAVGVNVVVDTVFNHMSSSFNPPSQGVGGSEYNGQAQDYPAVPYSELDFNQPRCSIDWSNVHSIRNCYLVSLNDLALSKDYVRGKVAEYLNDLIDIGVKGFRVDAAKHMWPGDIENIFSRVKDTHDGHRPLVYHEVISSEGEPIQPVEYFHLGKVTAFNYARRLECVRSRDFRCLEFSDQSLPVDGLHALVFVDNHDTQRHGSAFSLARVNRSEEIASHRMAKFDKNFRSLSYKDDYNYKLASGFMMANEFGLKRVMSSFFFDYFDQGEPNIAPEPAYVPDKEGIQPCNNGWVCEHRYASIMNMVKFSNLMASEVVQNWQTEYQSLGFSRGNRGFFAMGDLNDVFFYTGLPDGDYCDIIHDCKRKINIKDGWGLFNRYMDNDPVVAICVGC